jgi:hypothetical protein
MTGGGTAGQEKVTVQSATYATGTVTALVQPTGGPIATVNGMIIKNSAGNTVGQDLTISTLLTADVLTPVAGTVTLTSGSYTAVITTEAGGSFVSPTFSVP